MLHRSNQFATPVVLFAVLASAPAHAAFVQLDGFDGLAAGPIGGQNGWSTGGTPADNSSVDVTAAPAGLTGQALGSGTSNTDAYKGGFSIADGAAGTLFLRFVVDDLATAGLSFGLADSTINETAAGGSFNNFRPQVAIGATGLGIRNGAGSAVADQAIAADTAYSLWIVADNGSDSFTAYIQGGAYAAQTQITTGGGAVASFGFRSTDTDGVSGLDEPLTNFLIAMASSPGDNSVFFDDVWVDADAANLANPIPEPGSLALVAAGALVACRRARR